MSTDLVSFEASVISGRGQAATSCANDIQQINTDHALSLVNGSLNLVSKQPVWLDTDLALFKTDWRVYWTGWLEGFPVVIHRWYGSCPVHVFEIFADEILREKLHLTDGDKVTLSFPRVFVSSVCGVSVIDKLVWYAFWYGRERQIYNKNEKYWDFVRNHRVLRHSSRAMQQA